MVVGRTQVERGGSAVVMESGSVAAVGRRMGGEVVAWASDTHHKGMLEARVWAEEARLDSG